MGQLTKNIPAVCIPRNLSNQLCTSVQLKKYKYWSHRQIYSVGWRQLRKNVVCTIGEISSAWRRKCLDWNNCRWLCVWLVCLGHRWPTWSGRGGGWRCRGESTSPMQSLMRSQARCAYLRMWRWTHSIRSQYCSVRTSKYKKTNIRIKLLVLVTVYSHWSMSGGPCLSVCDF